MADIKFKIYDKNRKRLLSGTGYSITGDGELQTFNSKGEGFIVERIGAVPGDEDITGVVVLDECQWWIVDKIDERAVPLFSETAMDRIIGDVYEGVPKQMEILNKNID